MDLSVDLSADLSADPSNIPYGHDYGSLSRVSPTNMVIDPLTMPNALPQPPMSWLMANAGSVHYGMEPYFLQQYRIAPSTGVHPSMLELPPCPVPVGEFIPKYNNDNNSNVPYFYNSGYVSVLSLQHWSMAFSQHLFVRHSISHHHYTLFDGKQISCPTGSRHGNVGKRWSQRHCGRQYG